MMRAFLVLGPTGGVVQTIAQPADLKPGQFDGVAYWESKGYTLVELATARPQRVIEEAALACAQDGSRAGMQVLQDYLDSGQI